MPFSNFDWKTFLIECVKIALAMIAAGGSFAAVNSQLAPVPAAPEVKVTVLLPDHTVVPAKFEAK